MEITKRIRCHEYKHISCGKKGLLYLLVNFKLYFLLDNTGFVQLLHYSESNGQIDEETAKPFLSASCVAWKYYILFSLMKLYHNNKVRDNRSNHLKWR